MHKSVHTMHKKREINTPLVQNENAAIGPFFRIS